jgi:hypothetical protein
MLAPGDAQATAPAAESTAPQDQPQTPEETQT